MNKTIARINYLNDKIKQLNKMVEQGECFAAGITVEIAVGANSEKEPLVLDFGIYSDMAGILATMKKGLVDSRNENLKNARAELKELDLFCNSDANPLSQE